MAPVRLEELLRVLAISLASVLCGMIVWFLPAFAQPQHDAPQQQIAITALMLIGPFLVIATPITLITGLTLHLALRLVPLPRAALLLVFVGTGLAVMHFILRDGLLSSAPLVLSITVPAWLLYIFGPLKLWRYTFVPGLHSDF